MFGENVFLDYTLIGYLKKTDILKETYQEIDRAKHAHRRKKNATSASQISAKCFLGYVF